MQFFSVSIPGRYATVLQRIERVPIPKKLTKQCLFPFTNKYQEASVTLDSVETLIALFI